MKYKLNVLIFVLVSVNLSRQHGAKGGSYSGSFSSSSASSQASSFSSSSSGSFSATGSFNDIGAGLKGLAGGLAGAGANAGAGAFAGASGSAGSGSGFGGGLKDSSFANSGSQSASGSGIIGAVGGSGVKGTVVGGVGGTEGISGSGAAGNAYGSGVAGNSCGFGDKTCGSSGNLGSGIGGSFGSSGGSGSGSIGSSGSGGLGGSGSGSLGGSGSGNLGNYGSGSFGVSNAGSTATSSSGVGGSVGEAGSNGQTPGNENTFTPESTSGVACAIGDTKCTQGTGSSGSGNPEKTVLGNEGDINAISGSTAVGGNYGSNVRPTQPTQVFVPNVAGTGSESSSVGSSVSTGNTAKPLEGQIFSPNPSFQSGFPTQPKPTGSFSQGSTLGTGGLVPSSNIPTGTYNHIPTFDTGRPAILTHPTPTGSYGHGSSFTGTGFSKQPSFSGSQSGSPIGVGSTTNYGGTTSSSQGITGSGNFGSGSNFGTTTITHGGQKKPCCTGPFPGPSGSIYDSKPASSVPPVPHPSGSFPSTGITSSGSFGHGGGVSSGTGGLTTGSKGPCCKGPFPGPNGSIHDYKLASSVPIRGVDGNGPAYFPSKPHVTGGNVIGSYGTTGTHAIGGAGSTYEISKTDSHRPPCCKQFPGPSASIHYSIPASSIPSSGSSGSVSYVPSGVGSLPTTAPSADGVSSTVNAESQSSSTANSGSQAATHFIGQIHHPKPHHIVPAWNKDVTSGNGYASVYYKVPKPSIILHPPVISGIVPTKTVVVDEYKPLNPDFISLGETNVPTTGFPGGYTTKEQPDKAEGFATGGVFVQKPQTVISGSNVGYTTGKEIPSGIPGTITSGNINSQGTSGVDSGFATGTVSVEKSENKEQAKPIETTGTGSGFATGTVSVERPGQTVNFGKDTQSFETTLGSSTVGTDNFANVGDVQKPSTIGPAFGSEPQSKPSSFGTSGSFGTSFSGSFGTPVSKPIGSGYGVGSTGTSGTSVSQSEPQSINTSGQSGVKNVDDSGFATGSVLVQKPDGSVSGGNDLPSGSATYGINSANTGITSGSHGGSGSFGASGSNSFGYSGSGAFGGAGGSGLFGGNTGFGVGVGPETHIKGYANGPFGILAGANSGASASSGAHAGSSGVKGGGYAGASSNAGASGFSGVLGNLFGKEGLGGNLGVAGSGSFSKSGAFSKAHSFASSSSYAGSSSGSFSGHY